MCIVIYCIYSTLSIKIYISFRIKHSQLNQNIKQILILKISVLFIVDILEFVTRFFLFNYLVHIIYQINKNYDWSYLAIANTG
jgi:hypothetical protein